MINWDSYTVSKFANESSLRHEPHSEAMLRHKRFIQDVSSRIAQLKTIFERNHVEFGYTDTCVQNVEDWLIVAIKKSQIMTTRELKHNMRYSSLVRDVGIFVGCTIIKRTSHVKWVLSSANKDDLTYQHTVLSGFSRVPFSAYCIDPILLTQIYINLRIDEDIRALSESRKLISIISTAVSRDA
jgi:hypothetical protein